MWHAYILMSVRLDYVKRGKIIGQYWVLGLIDGCFVAGGCSIDYNGPGCDEAPDVQTLRIV